MENTETQNTANKFLLPVLGVVVIGILGFTLLGSKKTPDTVAPESSPATSTQPAVTTETTTSSDTAYKNGTYSVVGDYTSPGGQEELGVTLTIVDGIITDSEVEVLATRPISKERQVDFADNYKTQVVGKNIADLQLGKISGSSLTPKGFNDALEKIKTEAQS